MAQEQKTGTLSIEDLLSVETQSILEFGVDQILAAINRELSIHNAVMIDTLARLTNPTTERTAVYNGLTGGQMTKVDSFARVPTQKAKGFAPVAFPLEKFQYSVGWTGDYFKLASPADLARQFQNAQIAHTRAVQTEIKRAIYPSANYSFYDYLVDNYELEIKRFVNADGAQIAVGPNGEEFDGSTHTHYSAVNWGSAAQEEKDNAVADLVKDVVEHGHGSDVKLVVNIADETKVRSLTGFEAYPDPRIVFRQTDTPETVLDVTRIDNRPIGIVGAAEVWVKPWALPNYLFCYAEGDPNKPLALRQRSQGVLQGLRIAGTNSAFPLEAQFMEVEFGLGVQARTNGAVLYLGGSAYVNPTSF